MKNVSIEGFLVCLETKSRVMLQEI